MDGNALKQIGVEGPLLQRVLILARLAKKAGMDGVVASPLEVGAVRRACGKDFLIVTPGVRPAAASHGDQSRVATPSEAVRAGADYIVVGRPITAARDPRAAAQSILDEMAAAGRV
jgi:orotidine-5'-phosphate decarboxylase